MSDAAAFHELFPLGPDETPYRKLTDLHVERAAWRQSGKESAPQQNAAGDDQGRRPRLEMRSEQAG